MESKNVKQNVSKIFFVAIGVFLLVYTLTIVAMFLWAFMTSLKTSAGYAISSYKFPEKITFDNYAIAFRELKIPVSVGNSVQKVKIPLMIIYSIIYAGGVSAVSTLTCMIVSYCCARYQYRLSKIIYGFVIVTMSLPIVGAQVSELKVLHSLNLYDSFLGMFILKANFLGLYFLVFYAQFKTFSTAYAEAAKIDGANDFTVFFRIMLPLVTGTMIAVLMLNAITYWNDITMSKIYVPSRPTLAYAMLFFSTTPGSLPKVAAGAPVRIAACMLLVIPMLTLFILFSKKMMGSLTVGGVKG